MMLPTEAFHITSKCYEDPTSDLNTQKQHPRKREILLTIKDWYSKNSFIRCHTSGTTGTPKELKLNKKDICISVQSTLDTLRIRPHQSAFICLPMDYIAGKMMVFRSLLGKLEMVVVTPRSNPLEQLTERVTLGAMTPHQVSSSSAKDLKKIDKLLIGGAPLEEHIIEKIKGVGNEIYETYGATETLSHIALRSISPTLMFHFKTLEKITVYTNRSGCLCIRDGRFSPPKHIETNDVSDVLSPTEFRWIGRKDHVINTGGIKVFPEKVERTLCNKIPKPFFISKERDPLLGERVVLVVESASRFQLSNDQISELNPYEKPKKIYCVPNFERTASGKVKRRQTMDKYLKK